MAKRSEQESRHQQRSESEFEEKVLYINRTAKVVKGGRKFGFSALVLIGDLLNRVGFGFAKANEVSDAIRKATKAAEKNLLTVKKEKKTIPHEVHVQWDGVELMMKPAKEGTGVIAGPIIAAVLKFAGFEDVVTKIKGSNCPLNQVRAAFSALSDLRTKEETLRERGNL